MSKDLVLVINVWIKEESKVAGFFLFLHVRIMGYFRLISVPQGLETVQWESYCDKKKPTNSKSFLVALFSIFAPIENSCNDIQILV